MKKHKRNEKEEQGNKQHSAVLADLCYGYLKPLLVELNGRVDRRLVRTFLGLVMVIITHRHRN